VGRRFHQGDETGPEVTVVGVAVPLWAKAVDIPKGGDAVQVQVVGQQFNWHARYPGKDGKWGKQEMHFVNSTNTFGIDPSDPNGKDDVQLSLGEMHVVVNKPVVAYISSRDVIHSFKVIAMRVTQDAIPGMRVPLWFKPTTVGHYQINCAQLCGNAHSAMSAGMMVVDTQEDFDKWLAAQPTVGGAAAQSFE